MNNDNAIADATENRWHRGVDAIIIRRVLDSPEHPPSVSPIFPISNPRLPTSHHPFIPPLGRASKEPPWQATTFAVSFPCTDLHVSTRPRRLSQIPARLGARLHRTSVRGARVYTRAHMTAQQRGRRGWVPSAGYVSWKILEKIPFWMAGIRYAALRKWPDKHEADVSIFMPLVRRIPTREKEREREAKRVLVWRRVLSPLSRGRISRT